MNDLYKYSTAELEQEIERRKLLLSYTARDLTAALSQSSHIVADLQLGTFEKLEYQVKGAETNTVYTEKAIRGPLRVLILDEKDDA